MNATEAYVHCSLGHVHWGSLGAAGLLIVADSVDGPRYLLQHRAEASHHGLTWGIPGGALNPQEDSFTAALREASEEMGDLPSLALLHRHVEDHGSWAYSTFVVRAETLFRPVVASWETGPEGFRWFTAEELCFAPLHPGFAVALPQLMAGALVG